MLQAIRSNVCVDSVQPVLHHSPSQTTSAPTDLEGLLKMATTYETRLFLNNEVFLDDSFLISELPNNSL